MPVTSLTVGFMAVTWAGLTSRTVQYRHVVSANKLVCPKYRMTVDQIFRIMINIIENVGMTDWDDKDAFKNRIYWLGDITNIVEGRISTTDNNKDVWLQDLGNSRCQEISSLDYRMLWNLTSPSAIIFPKRISDKRRSDRTTLNKDMFGWMTHICESKLDHHWFLTGAKPLSEPMMEYY